MPAPSVVGIEAVAVGCGLAAVVGDGAGAALVTVAAVVGGAALVTGAAVVGGGLVARREAAGGVGFVGLGVGMTPISGPFAHVTGPTMPSTARPAERWNCRTALAVIGP